MWHKAFHCVNNLLPCTFMLLFYIILSFVKSIDYLNVHHITSSKIVKDQKNLFLLWYFA